MGVVVAFDWSQFQAQWPAYAPIGQTLAQSYFDVATTIHANDGSGPVNNAVLQLRMLNALTAHLAQLFAPRDGSGTPAASGSPPPTLAVVGRVSSATEGSVSVQTAAMEGFSTDQASWLSQTQPGSLYWIMTKQFRTARYIAPRCRPAIVGGFPISFDRR